METESIKIIEAIEDDKKILRIEGKGDDDYYSHKGFDKIDFVSKGIELKTYGSKDGLNESFLIDAVCKEYGSSLEVIGCPKSNTSEIKLSIEPNQNSEWQGTIIMMYEDDFLSPGYTNKNYRWSCSIYVPEEFYKKLKQDYRSNRIESLDIGISAQTSHDYRLWRYGSTHMPVNYNGGDRLFLRPDGDEIKSKGFKSAMAEVTCTDISYKEPAITTKSQLDDELSEELYGEPIEHEEEQSQNIQKETYVLLRGIKKYLKIASYSLLFIALILLFK
jgi:hypothetical protein